MAYTNKRLLISVKHIQQAARNKDYCDALAFAIAIKASHRNSMLLNYSWRKIMSLCHCNLDKAKKLRDDAIDLGLIRVTHDGKHIVAVKLHNIDNKKHDWCIPFFLHNTCHGNLISLSNSNHGKDYQTIKYTSDLILHAAIANNINGYNRQLNTWQIRAKKRKTTSHYKDVVEGKYIGGKRYDVDERGITMPLPSEMGYSHAKMLKNIFNNSIGLSKLKSLLQQMKKDGHLRIRRSHIHHITIKYEERLELEHYYPIINEATGERELRHIHRRKIPSKEERNGEYDEFFRPMANKYDKTGIFAVRKTLVTARRRKHSRNGKTAPTLCFMLELFSNQNEPVVVDSLSLPF